MLAKENHMRMDATLSDELGGKVIKVDAGSNDNGLLSSQNQNAEKAFEATSLSKHADPGQESLRNQTLDQIVRKAVIYMRNGQHEAKIDLKPEFLGHVRMQVITENNQVTVKILTEFGFVKDMVENNIQQLKTDLQQQGLNVDKLEVGVSDDTDGHKHRQQKTGQTKNTQHSASRIDPKNGEEEIREETGDFGLSDPDTAAVDYFA
jgi:flagellar hook-length control protein FliK